jgi:sortase A
VVRKTGFAVLGLGVALFAWVAVTVRWGDPITSLYTGHEQRALSRQLDSLSDEWAQFPAARLDVADGVALLRARAAAFGRSLRDGEALGRIVVPRLHLDMVFVQGTSESDLRRGPGHYDAASGRATALPGTGGVVAIAGHRTTYLHPFRHIDDLRPGDNIYLSMPYGTLRYTVFGHRVVASTDWTILRPRPFEELVLSACHPLYSATHRWVVYARLRGEGRPSLRARSPQPDQASVSAGAAAAPGG